MLLGFSSGLPLALSGSTLLVWMREAGVDLGTIGLFALVGTPYTLKFLWAPLVDALHVPLLHPRFGRRRGWLVFSQLLLIAAILLLALTDPGALAAARRARARCWSPPRPRRRTSWSTRSASRACPRASRPPAWRPTSRPTASACWSRPQARCSSSPASSRHGLARNAAWMWGYVVMAALVLIGTHHRARRDRAGTVAARRSGHARRQRLHARGAGRGRRVLGIPDAQGCVRRARLCRAVQVHRRVLGHDDRAVRDRPRLFARSTTPRSSRASALPRP